MREPVTMPSSAVQPTRRALWIPGLFVLGFLIVTAVNGVLIFAAVDSFSGLETDNAYEKGIHYNQALAAAAVNAQTGWHAEPSVTTGSDGLRQLDVLITDRAGMPVTALAVEAFLVRPTNAGMDTVITLQGQGAGHYAAHFKPNGLGNWELRLMARRGESAWQQTQRIFLQ